MGFSLVVESGGHSLVVVRRLLNCGGFSCCGAWALGCVGSVAVVHGLSYSVDQLLPGSEIEPVSLSLAGGFFTAEPAGKSLFSILLLQYCLLAGHLPVNSAYLSCQ